MNSKTFDPGVEGERFEACCCVCSWVSFEIGNNRCQDGKYSSILVYNVICSFDGLSMAMHLFQRLHKRSGLHFSCKHLVSRVLEESIKLQAENQETYSLGLS